MIFRRFALAIGLLFAGLASQLPEFTQQYRQRLGGAIDELQAIVAQFDAEASSLALDRDQGIARLKSNPDTLAQERGTSVAEAAARKDRLEQQKRSFSTAGPLSQYAVLAEDFDFGIARQAYADFQPAVPVTSAGFISGAIGLGIGWLCAHALALPLRRRQKPAARGTA
jgi:hypothetical protein